MLRRAAAHRRFEQLFGCRRNLQRLGHAADTGFTGSAIAPEFGPTRSTPSLSQQRNIAAGCRRSTTSADSSPAPAAPAGRSRAGWRWRDRRRGRSPSSPSGPRSPAQRRSGRSRGQGVCGRRRTRSAGRTGRCSSARRPGALAASGVTKCSRRAVSTQRTCMPPVLQPANQIQRFCRRRCRRR